MSDMSVRSYYERYWSSSGFHPTGSMSPALEGILTRWVGPNSRCLDVGCGDGRTCGPWLLERGCEYRGVDVSQNAVDEAKALGLSVERVDDSGLLPFDDGAFDVTVCIEVLEHLMSPLDTVNEMARVLRPGGLLIATVPNVAYWRRRMDMLLLGRWNPVGDHLAVEEPWRDPHIRFFNPGTLRRMITSAGLTPLLVGGHGGGILRDLPWIGRRFRSPVASAPYRAAQAALPSIFGASLHVVARK